MKSITKKIFIVFICFTLLLTTFSGSLALNVKQKDTQIETNPDTDIESEKEEITIIRFGPKGNVEPLSFKIDVDNIEDIGDYIADKCEELFNNDIEIQGFLGNQTNNTNNNTSKIFNLGWFSIVKSSGKGFHYQKRYKLRFTLVLKLFKLRLPKIRLRLRRPLIFCRYNNDPNAYTTIKPILNKNNTKVVEGNHSVMVRSFIGYTGWIGHFSNTPYDLLPRGFYGYSRFTFCRSFS